MRLERAPQMPLYQLDGTILIQENHNLTTAENQVNTLQGMFLTSTPEELVDLIDDYQTLINYVKLFYEYQVFIHEWRDYESIDVAYQELKNMQTVMECISDYQKEIRLLKFDYPHVIDDVTLKLLEVEILLTEETSFAQGKLSSIRNTIGIENLIPEDRKRFCELFEKCGKDIISQH